MRGSTNFIIVIVLSLAALVMVWLDSTWLMPGPVSSPHAKIEAECEKCHSPWTGVTRNNCLSCKTEMRYVEDRGIHKYAPIKECQTCHREHRTRPYPIASAWVNPEQFDHLWAGFDLKPWHAEATCGACHPKAGNYRKRQDVSGALLPPDKDATCETCHTDFNPVAWRHEKSACRLDPIHGGLKCSYCHTNGWGEGKKPSCKGCHKNKKEAREVCPKHSTGGEEIK